MCSILTKGSTCRKNKKIEIFVDLNSLSATGDRGRQPPLLLPPLLGATRVDTIIHNYRLASVIECDTHGVPTQLLTSTHTHT